MDINGFFDDLNAKTWRNNIESEVTVKVESLLSQLDMHKEDIISTIIEDLSLLEDMKLEEQDEYTYPVFQKWVTTLTIQNIVDDISEE